MRHICFIRNIRDVVNYHVKYNMIHLKKVITEYYRHIETYGVLQL